MQLSPSPIEFESDANSRRFPESLDGDTLRRLHPRVPVREAACYLSSTRIIIARAADVSMTGMFVETIEPDPLGTHSHVRLVRDDDEVILQAEVTRVCFLMGRGDRPGMGLMFDNVSPQARRFLAEYVASARVPVAADALG